MKPDPPIIQAAPQRLHWQTWHTRITRTRRTRLSHDRHSESTRTHSANGGRSRTQDVFPTVVALIWLWITTWRVHQKGVVHFFFFFIFVISKLICDGVRCGERRRYICCLTSRGWALGECSRASRVNSDWVWWDVCLVFSLRRRTTQARSTGSHCCRASPQGGVERV